MTRACPPKRRQQRRRELKAEQSARLSLALWYVWKIVEWAHDDAEAILQGRAVVPFDPTRHLGAGVVCDISVETRCRRLGRNGCVRQRLWTDSLHPFGNPVLS